MKILVGLDDDGAEFALVTDHNPRILDALQYLSNEWDWEYRMSIDRLMVSLLKFKESVYDLWILDILNDINAEIHQNQLHCWKTLMILWRSNVDEAWLSLARQFTSTMTRQVRLYRHFGLEARHMRNDLQQFYDSNGLDPALISPEWQHMVTESRTKPIDALMDIGRILETLSRFTKSYDTYNRLLFHKGYGGLFYFF